MFSRVPAHAEVALEQCRAKLDPAVFEWVMQRGETAAQTRERWRRERDRAIRRFAVLFPAFATPRVFAQELALTLAHYWTPTEGLRPLAPGASLAEIYLHRILFLNHEEPLQDRMISYILNQNYGL